MKPTSVALLVATERFHPIVAMTQRAYADAQRDRDAWLASAARKVWAALEGGE